MEGYRVSEERKQAVKATFDVTDEDIAQRIETLQEWIDTCPDLPEEAKDEDFLDMMLLRAKFKDEFAKRNIFNYYKTVKKYPEIFTNLGNFKPSEEVGVVVAVPTVTPTLERINILKVTPENLATKTLNIEQLCQVIISTGLIMFLTDYTANCRFILDFKGVTIRDVLTVNIRTLFKLARVAEDMLRARISGIELLNTSRIVSGVLNIARLFFKPKLFSRITVHKDLESLQRNVPPDSLPFEYGGNEESIEKLLKSMDNIISGHRSLFERVANLVASAKEEKT